MWFPFYCPVIIIIWSMKTEGKSEPVCKSQCDQSGVVCCVQCTVQPVITCVACTVCTLVQWQQYGCTAQCTHHRLLHPSEPAPVQRSVLGSLLSQGVAVAELPYSVITDPSVVTMWHPEVTTVCVTHWHSYPGDVVNWCQVARLCSFITSALTSGHLC